MKEIVFVKKSDVTKGLKELDVINVFENSNNLEQIKQAVENSEDRIYASWASVDARDNAGEIIPINDVINNQDILMERNGPISDEHTNKIVGRTLAYKVLEHPESKTLGVLQLEKIYNHNPADEKVWGEIISGKRTGSSVGGVNTSIGMGRDEITGKATKVLEGFSQMETASVVKPCNPFATNVAYSVVAKSNCIGKECENQETVINKEQSNNNIDPNIGDNMENEDIKKSISELADVVKGIASKVDKMAEEKKPEDKPVKDEKKEDTPVEEKPKEEEKPVAKEDAASDIDGESSAPAPATPVEDQSNDTDVFKSEIAEIKKSVEELKSLIVTKSQTPAAPVADVKKNSNLAMDLAMGKKKMTYTEIHKTLKEGV